MNRLSKFSLLAVIWFFVLPISAREMQNQTSDSQSDITSITVAVATNFVSPMKKIAAAFQRKTDLEVKIVSGSSGKLYAQIINLAPYDLFFSADIDKPSQLEAAGMIMPDSRYTYAVGSLVLWTAENKRDVDLSVLTENRFKRLAIANPKLAPYGVAAMQLLDNLGLWEKPHLSLVYGENIAQTYQFTATANADYGLIALSQLASQDCQNCGSYWVVPQTYHLPIKQQAVMLMRATTNPRAQQFYTFMQSSEARHIIQQSGYTSALAERDHVGN